MVALAIIWAVLSGFAVGVGVEPVRSWQRLFDFHIAETLRKFAFLGGIGVSLLTLAFSFIFLVMSNAVVVIVAWALIFILTRITLEIMGRRNTYLELDDADKFKPEPQAPKRDLSRRTPEMMRSPLMDPLAAKGIGISNVSDPADTAQEQISEPGESPEKVLEEDVLAEDRSDMPKPLDGAQR